MWEHLQKKYSYSNFLREETEIFWQSNTIQWEDDEHFSNPYVYPFLNIPQEQMFLLLINASIQLFKVW